MFVGKMEKSVERKDLRCCGWTEGKRKKELEKRETQRILDTAKSQRK